MNAVSECNRITYYTKSIPEGHVGQILLTKEQWHGFHALGLFSSKVPSIGAGVVERINVVIVKRAELKEKLMAEEFYALNDDWRARAAGFETQSIEMKDVTKIECHDIEVDGLDELVHQKLADRAVA